MTRLIECDNVSEAWLEAMRALGEERGETANMIVCLRSPVVECPAVTAALDTFLRSHPKAFPIEKIAGTIFPREFYLPDRLGADAQRHLYDNHRLARIIEDRWSKKGNYFDRMVRWPGRDGSEINQLEKKIGYYRAEVGRGKGICNIFEIALSNPENASYDASYADEEQDIRIYDPERDRSIMSFPCLSHVSISMTKGKLHMTATYRNQFFLQKAYGNYLGLLRLLNFLAREIGIEVGELVCIATHADDEVGSQGFKRSAVSHLLRRCEDMVQAVPSVPVELLYVRPVPSRSRTALAA